MLPPVRAFDGPSKWGAWNDRSSPCGGAVDNWGQPPPEGPSAEGRVWSASYPLHRGTTPFGEDSAEVSTSCRRVVPRPQQASAELSTLHTPVKSVVVLQDLFLPRPPTALWRAALERGGGGGEGGGGGGVGGGGAAPRGQAAPRADPLAFPR